MGGWYFSLLLLLYGFATQLPMVYSRYKRAASLFDKGDAKLWGTDISYEISKDLSADTISKIKESLSLVEKYTCIKFKEFKGPDTDETNRLAFAKTEKRCSALFGMQGGKQLIQISEDPSEGCVSIGLLCHEVFHSLGLKHEISRPDRDEYIKLHPDSITDMGQFAVDDKLIYKQYPYDLSSVMHYDDMFMRKHPEEFTFEVLKPDMKYWVRRNVKTYMGPSFGDWITLNDIYGCTDKCKDKRKTCANSGVVGGSECKCICPVGLKGDTCIERDADCGANLKGKSGEIETPKLFTSFETPVAKKICSWLIEAGPDDVVLLSFVDYFNIDNRGDDGMFNYVEIRQDGLGSPGVRIYESRDHTRMGYFSKGPMFIEMGVDDTDAFNVGFKAHFQVVPADKYKPCKVLCRNGAELDDSCSCKCPKGYHGKQCENYENKMCTGKLPCFNRGIVDSTSSDCNCKCPSIPNEKAEMIGPRCQFFGFCHQRISPAEFVQLTAPLPINDDSGCAAKCDDRLLTKSKCPLACATKCLCDDHAEISGQKSCGELSDWLEREEKGSGQCAAGQAMQVYCQKFCKMCPDTE